MMAFVSERQVSYVGFKDGYHRIMVYGYEVAVIGYTKGYIVDHKLSAETVRTLVDVMPDAFFYDTLRRSYGALSYWGQYQVTLRFYNDG